MCDLETSRMGAPYIYDISRLRVNITPSAKPRIYILVCNTSLLYEETKLNGLNPIYVV